MAGTEEAEVPYLAICPWDIERWQNSRAYRRMSLAAQGAYLNLCLGAWKAQPACRIPDDDRELWRLANARTIDEWRAVKAEVFDSDAWVWDPPRGWLQEVVLEMYQEAARRHAVAVRSGRIAGRASARARRALAQSTRTKEDGTAVERPSTQARSTIVNPPSPSPSPSGTDNPPYPPAAAGGGRPFPQAPPGANGDGTTDAATEERRAARRRVENQVEQARLFCITNGGHPGRRHIRLFRRWFLAGWSLADVQEAIERGEHKQRPP